MLLHSKDSPSASAESHTKVFNVDSALSEAGKQKSKQRTNKKITR